MPDPQARVVVNSKHIQMAQTLMEYSPFRQIYEDPELDFNYREAQNIAEKRGSAGTAILNYMEARLDQVQRYAAYERARDQLNQLVSGAPTPACQMIELSFIEAAAIRDIIAFASRTVETGGVNYLGMARVSQGQFETEVETSPRDALKDAAIYLFEETARVQARSVIADAAALARAARGYDAAPGSAARYLRGQASHSSISLSRAQRAEKLRRDFPAETVKRLASQFKTTRELAFYLQREISDQRNLVVGELILGIGAIETNAPLGHNTPAQLKDVKARMALNLELDKKKRKDRLPVLRVDNRAEQVVSPYRDNPPVLSSAEPDFFIKAKLADQKPVLIAIKSLPLTGEARLLESIPWSKVFAVEILMLQKRAQARSISHKLSLAGQRIERLRDELIKGNMTWQDLSLQNIADLRTVVQACTRYVHDAWLDKSLNTLETMYELKAQSKIHPHPSIEEVAVVYQRHQPLSPQQEAEEVEMIRRDRFIETAAQFSFGKSTNEFQRWLEFSRGVILAYPSQFKSVAAVLNAVEKDAQEIRDLFTLSMGRSYLAEYDKARRDAISKGVFKELRDRLAGIREKRGTRPKRGPSVR